MWWVQIPPSQAPQEFWHWDLITTTGVSPAPRAWHATGIVGDKFFVGFGQDAQGEFFNDGWIFNITTSTWSNITTGAASSVSAPGFCIDNSSTWVVAGDGSSNSNVLELSSQGSKTLIVNGGSIPVGLYAPAMSFIGNTLYLFGGRIAQNSLNSLWMLSPQSSSWQDITPAFSPSRRYGESMVTIGEEIACLFGGNTVPITEIYNDVWCYNASSSR
jgi:N-acetylneuraminic acid mutarotase